MIKVLTEKLHLSKLEMQSILDKTLPFFERIKLETLCGITAISYGILIFSTILASNIDIGYKVVVNDKNYGTVSTQSEAKAVLAEALLEITNSKENFSYSQAGYFLNLKNKSNIASSEFVKNEIVADLDGLTFGYGISVDGNVVAALTNEEEAKGLVNELLNSYKTENNEVSFVNNIEVVGTRVRNGLLMSRESAASVLTGSKNEAVEHIVKSGDTFSQIAESYGLSTSSLMNINAGINPDKLQIGQKLSVTASIPLVSIQTVEQITVEEKIPYTVTEQKDISMYQGIRKVLKSGVNGKKSVVYNVKKVNNNITEQTAVNETILSNPTTEIVAVGTKIKPKEAPTGTFIRPYYGTITSRYGSRWGRNHNGIDYGGRTGDPVKASDGGTVTYAGWYSGYGKFVKINHGNGKETYYGHLSAINVKNGQKVAQGAVIGKVGNTGNSTGPHLHFEIRINGKPVNPSSYVN